jgi:hypothetical protein
MLVRIVKYLLDLERMRQDTEKLQRMAGVSTDVVMKIERTARRWETISSGLGIVQSGKMWMGQHVRPRIRAG